MPNCCPAGSAKKWPAIDAASCEERHTKPSLPRSLCRSIGADAGVGTGIAVSAGAVDVVLEIAALRRPLGALKQQRTAVALGLFVAAILVYLACFVATTLLEPWWARVITCLALGPLVAFLFRIAHDAGHGSHAQSRFLNRIIGHVAIMPSYHPYRVWRHYHNATHHAFTNLRGRDYIWVPLSYAEYCELSPLRRYAERTYRSVKGVGIYYLVEIWLRQMMLARGPVLRDRSYVRDWLVMLGFALGQMAAIVALTVLHQQFSLTAVLFNIVLAMVIPFLVFTWLVGYVSFLNHTHPRVPWFANAAEWSFRTGQVRCSVRMAVPLWLVFFITDLGLHAAHHIEPRIPIWKLGKAQRHFAAALRDAVFERWSIPVQAAIFARCKLYDYKSHRWLDFAGRPTTDSIGPRAVSDRVETLFVLSLIHI